MKKIILLALVVLFVFSAIPAFPAGEEPQAVFISLDVDKDGKVTQKELCVLYTDKVACEKKFIAYDKNGDGYIVLEEFVAAFKD